MKKKCKKKENIGFGTNVIKIIENVKIFNDDKVTHGGNEKDIKNIE